MPRRITLQPCDWPAETIYCTNSRNFVKYESRSKYPSIEPRFENTSPLHLHHLELFVCLPGRWSIWTWKEAWWMNTLSKEWLKREKRWAADVLFVHYRCWYLKIQSKIDFLLCVFICLYLVTHFILSSMLLALYFTIYFLINVNIFLLTNYQTVVWDPNSTNTWMDNCTDWGCCGLFQWFFHHHINAEYCRDHLLSFDVSLFCEGCEQSSSFVFPSSLKQTVLTAKNIVIATGGRPKYPTNVSVITWRWRAGWGWLPGRQSSEKHPSCNNRWASTTEVVWRGGRVGVTLWRTQTNLKVWQV